MRVLSINRDFRSGQTTHVDTLAAALQALGVCTAIARYDSIAEQMPAATRAGVPQLRFTDTLSLIREIQRFEPDLLHAHSSSTWPYAARAATSAGVPLVLTAHGPGVDLPVNQAAIRKASAVVVPGPATARALTIPTVCIANGVDLTRFRPGRKASPPVVAYIGRVDSTRSEGFRAFCDATRQLPARVWFFGSGARPPSHVRAFGWRSDLERWLPRVDVACAVGRSLREAQACGAMGLVLGRRYHGPILNADLANQVQRDVWYGEHLAPVPRDRTTVQLRGDLLTLLSAPARLKALQAESRTLAMRFADLAEKAHRHRDLYRAVLAGEHIPVPRLRPRTRPAVRSGDVLLGMGPAGQHPVRLDRLSPALPAPIRFAVRLSRGAEVRLLTVPGRPPLKIRAHTWRGRPHLSVTHGRTVVARRGLEWARWIELRLSTDGETCRLGIAQAPPIEIAHASTGRPTVGPVRMGVCHIVQHLSESTERSR